MALDQVQGHDLVPGCHEIADKLLFAIGAAVYLGDCTQMGVGTEYEIDADPFPRPLLASLIDFMVAELGCERRA